MDPQWVRGTTSKQAHAGLPPGTVEEEHGRDGFSGPASHLYRLHAPTGWTDVVGPLQPHALDPSALTVDDAPVALLVNDEVRISTWRPRGEAFWRFGDGDALCFVHRGSGVLGTEYGPLRYRAGDYLLIPRTTTHRFDCEELTEVLVVEALEGRMQLPDRGLLGRHALFDPAILEVPEPEPRDEQGEFEIRLLRRGTTTTITYPFHPFDVVGWKGDLAPWRLNVDDIRPVVSPRYHLPPSVHTTLLGPGFVVATFAPRPLESDPDALRLPFFHRNVDYDEVIFYHRGEFMSRAGITEGMLTFHPSGIHHGPQPKAVQRSEERGPGGFADEVAINIDARRPLVLTAEGERSSVEGYVRSWR
ncbi:MAG TPA: homogentisate 1,2-dioxygenase [Acidimicrobiales bacterium]|nr:homogentisate 1,2-dioxygenase [Acidimicrobiales bacterium]